jgi:hypothetical protein
MNGLECFSAGWIQIDGNRSLMSRSENRMARKSVVAEKNIPGQADTCSNIGGLSTKTAPKAQVGEGADLDSTLEFSGETRVFVDLCREEEPWTRCITYTYAGDLGQGFVLSANTPSIEIGGRR